MAVDAYILKVQDFPGLGDNDYPGFPADECPEHLADLSKHHSLMADVFKRRPELYAQLRARRTALGVGLARCIKTGMDNRGHPMIKTVGTVAGDEECYETFRPLFDELVRLRHGEQCLARPHASAAPRVFLSQLRPDPTEKYVLSVQVRAARNLRGVRFSPACSFDERREVERVAARALLELEGPLKGSYHPLRGSQSYPSKAGGMSAETEQELQRKGLLFSFPDSSAVLSSGTGRHWPDARGVFLNEAQTLAVWVNEEEHLRAVAAQQGGDLKGAFQQITDALDGVVASFKRHKDCSQGFAYSDRLGYLTSCPSNIGTALRVSTIVRLPLITSRQNRLLSDWCAGRRLTARSATGESGSQLQGVLEISHRDRLGVSENETVNLLINSVAELVHAERLLEHGGAGLQLPAPDALAPVAPAPAEAAPAPAEAGAGACAPVIVEEDDLQWDLAGATLGMLFAGALGGEGAPPAGAAQPAAAAAAQGAALPPALADIKSRTAAMLDAAADTGALSTALGSLVVSQQLEPRAQQVHDVRQRTAELLFQASNDGTLNNALASIGGDDLLTQARAAEKIQAVGRGMLGRKKTNEIKDKRRSLASGATDALGPALGEMRRVLEAALEDGSLERLLQSHEFADTTVEDSLADVRARAASPKPPQGGISDIRGRTADLLWDACDSGALEQALGTLRQQAEVDVEDIRARMKDRLHEAVDNGSLDKAFENLSTRDEGATEDGRPPPSPPPPTEAAGGVDMNDVRSRMLLALSGAAATFQAGQAQDLKAAEAAPKASDVDEIRKKVRQGLAEGFASGRLERYLKGDAAANEPSEITPFVAQPVAVKTLAKQRIDGVAFSQCAKALLEAISGCDRRIGLLSATIAEVRRVITERDIQASQIESDLDTMRQDFQALDTDIDRQREAIEQAEVVSARLHESGRKLADEIDAENLKQRHAAVDLDSSIFSFRSETSTACTMRDQLPLELTCGIGPIFMPIVGNPSRS